MNHYLSGLSQEELTLYAMERKDPFIAWLLCAALGSFGAHHFYLGNTRTGMLRLLFSFTGVPTIQAAFELFTIMRKTEEHNQELLELIQEAAAIYRTEISHEFVTVNGPYAFEPGIVRSVK